MSPLQVLHVYSNPTAVTVLLLASCLIIPIFLNPIINTEFSPYPIIVPHTLKYFFYVTSRTQFSSLSAASQPPMLHPPPLPAV